MGKNEGSSESRVAGYRFQGLQKGNRLRVRFADTRGSIRDIGGYATFDGVWAA